MSSAKSSITNARSISALIATLLGSADTADTVTGQTTPYLSNLLSGKGLTDAPLNVQASGKNMSITKGKESTTATPADHRLSQDVELCPPPATARMLFLPPGQPGTIKYSSISPAKTRLIILLILHSCRCQCSKFGYCYVG